MTAYFDAATISPCLLVCSNGVSHRIHRFLYFITRGLHFPSISLCEFSHADAASGATVPSDFHSWSTGFDASPECNDADWQVYDSAVSGTQCLSLT